MIFNPVFQRVAAVLFILGTVTAQAAPPSPAEFPDAYANTSLETEVPVMSSGHLVLFSPVREVNDAIRSDSMAKLAVRGSGRLYEISRDATREAARDHYQSVLQARGAQVLFQCSGRSCGRSNVWANQIFGQATLYGRDTDQDYLIAAHTNGTNQTWLTLVYTVTRGNQREYVWVEHLEVAEGAVIPGLESASARVRGPIIVPWQGGITYRFNWNAIDRRMLNEWAAEEGAQVMLTGYSALRDNESLEDAMARAEGALNSLSRVLDKSGVSQSLQTLINVGPAVVMTAPDRQGDRIEIVVIKR